MNQNMKLESTETLKGVDNGREYDFDRYNFVGKPFFSTKEVSVAISYKKDDKQPITGDMIAYGRWEDLGKEELKSYVQHLIDNNKLLRDLPENALESLEINFYDVVDYFNDHPDLNFYVYDGTEQPKKINDLKTLVVESVSLNGTKDVTKEFHDYFMQVMNYSKRAAEYQYEQPFIDGEFELWINPTLEQLQEYNEMENLDINENLESFKGYEHVIYNETLTVLKEELEEKGYLVFSGSGIIETLKKDFEIYIDDDTPFEEYVQPVQIYELDREKLYVIDNEISFNPIEIESLIDERYGQESLINSKEINSYINNLIATKKGVEHSTAIDISNLSFYTFEDLDDYLNIEEFESFDEAYNKLFNQGINMDEPFIEIGVLDREYYKNSSEFKTENDLIVYINGIFDKERIDIEVKSFDRVSIMKERMNENDKEEIER